MVIFSTSILSSVLSLVFLIITGGFILLILEIEFLSFIIMLLYIGAVAVLFLFVILMLQLNKNHSKYLKMSFLSTDGILYLLFGLKIVFLIFYLNKKLSCFISAFSYQFTTFDYDSYSFVDFLLIGGDSIIFLGLFTQKYYFLILVGIILLFAMVGSIVLCVSQIDLD